MPQFYEVVGIEDFAREFLWNLRLRLGNLDLRSGAGDRLINLRFQSLDILRLGP